MNAGSSGLEEGGTGNRAQVVGHIWVTSLPWAATPSHCPVLRSAGTRRQKLSVLDPARTSVAAAGWSTAGLRRGDGMTVSRSFRGRGRSRASSCPRSAPARRRAGWRGLGSRRRRRDVLDEKARWRRPECRAGSEHRQFSARLHERSGIVWRLAPKRQRLSAAHGSLRLWARSSSRSRILRGALARPESAVPGEGP